VKIVLTATALGAACGLTVGVAAAFFHVNVPPMVMRGVALGPSVSGLLFGGITGFVIGMIILMRSRRA
jgi:hypothetical protein